MTANLWLCESFKNIYSHKQLKVNKLLKKSESLTIKMRKSKEIANEICVVYADAIMQENWQLFTKQLSDVFMEVAVEDVQELRQMRNVKTDNGLIPIFKEQRQKYNAICKVVNTFKSDLLSVTDFDEVIKEVHPQIYEWYVNNVVAKHIN